MINNPKLIEKIIKDIENISEEDLDKVIQEADKEIKSIKE